MRTLEVSDYELWGRLVKTWATGKSYLPGGQIFPAPRTIAELRQQVAILGCATVPPDITEVEIATCPANTLRIALPSKEQIEGWEDAAKSHRPYPLPDFYLVDLARFVEMSIEEKMAFHAKRIGDYTAGACG